MNMKRFLSVLLMLPIFLTACFNDDTDPDTDTDTDTDDDEEMDNSITVEEQKPSKTVMIEEAIIEKASFIVIHEEDEDGNPGSVIGKSSLLLPGTRQNVSITLDRDAKDGETLIAMMHTDNGDSTFDELKDAPALNNDDEEVMEEFDIAK